MTWWWYITEQKESFGDTMFPVLSLSKDGNIEEIAHNLYATLHLADKQKKQAIHLSKIVQNHPLSSHKRPLIKGGKIRSKLSIDPSIIALIIGSFSDEKSILITHLPCALFSIRISLVFSSTICEILNQVNVVTYLAIVCVPVAFAQTDAQLRDPDFLIQRYNELAS